jgi:hypothetical protein
MSRGRRFDAKIHFGRDGAEVLDWEQLDNLVQYFEENVILLKYLRAKVEQHSPERSIICSSQVLPSDSRHCERKERICRYASALGTTNFPPIQ